MEEAQLAVPASEVKEDGPFDELDEPENGNWGGGSESKYNNPAALSSLKGYPGSLGGMASQQNSKSPPSSKPNVCSAYAYVRESPFQAIPPSDLCPQINDKMLSDVAAKSASWAGTAWLAQGSEQATRAKSFSAHYGPNRVGRLVVIRHRDGGVLGGVKAGDVTYSLHLDATGPALLWARKWRKARVRQYVISADPNDLTMERQKRGPGYVGKLKNVNGDQRVYTLFDGGEKSNGTRRELAAVIYTHERAATDTLSEPKMEVAVPSVEYSSERTNLEPSSNAGRGAAVATSLSGGDGGTSSGGGEQGSQVAGSWCVATPPSSLRDLFSKSRWQGSENHLHADTMTVLREAMEAEVSGAGHSSSPKLLAAPASEGGEVPSVKNFRLQLALPATHGLRAQVRAAAGGTSACAAAQTVPLLRMDKASKDEFVLKFTQPFSVLQAFGVALSRFDTKQVK